MTSLLFFLLLGAVEVESVVHMQNLVLEPIYRLSDTDANPTRSIYFTKLPQYFVMSSEVINASQYPIDRGFTREMFLKDLACGQASCQNFPIQVVAVYNVIDSNGRLKFETSPSESDQNLGKAGYLSVAEDVGLVRYDEYYSEQDGLFAYTNGQYPNQFGACQLRDYLGFRYKFVRTLGYAFTPIEIPTNLPIYTMYGYDDGIARASSLISFGANQIWTMQRANGIQGVGATNLPWTPPASAQPLSPTNVCLLTGSLSALSRCGNADNILQFFNSNRTYIGFRDSINGTVDTYIYSYIGYAFRTDDNVCSLPLVPIREMYKEGVGFTVVAGDAYITLLSSGYTLTNNTIAYTIDCSSTTNSQIVADVPDESPVTPSTTPSPSQVGYYAHPLVTVIPYNSNGTQQGYWFAGHPLNTTFHYASLMNVCIFTHNETILPQCGKTASLNLYYDIEDNFFFVSIDSKGRSVTEEPIAIAFQSAENICGLDLVPIRELYKEGLGYNAIAGDDYTSYLAEGYVLTGNIMGYTVNCDDVSGGTAPGTLPQVSTAPVSTVTTTKSTTESTTESTTTQSTTTTSSITYVCPDDYHSFVRTPTANNSYTSLWCVKAIFTATNTTDDPITETEALALCSAEDAVMTIYENADEKAIVVADLEQDIADYRNSQNLGSIRMDGQRTPECFVMNRTIINNPPCTDPFKAFYFSDNHTDPSYVLTNWARLEPSGTFWNDTTMESCIVMGLSVFPARSELTNDFYCDLTKAPDNIGALEFWPWGALCGKLPTPVTPTPPI